MKSNEIFIYKDINDSNNRLSSSLMLESIFEKVDVLNGIVSKGQKVLVKPNFVAPFSKAITDLNILKVLVQKIKSAGGIPVIGESSGFEFETKSTFSLLGIYEFSKENDVEIINFDEDEFVEIDSGWDAVPKYKIAKSVFECDVIINVPKLKKHSLTKVTIGMKNLFGVLHRDTRRKIHAFNLEKGIYVLNKLVKSSLIIVDGIWSLESAVFSDASYRGIIFGGKDVALIDYVGCNLLNIDYRDVNHIKYMVKTDAVKAINLIDILGNAEVPAVVKNNTNICREAKESLKKLAYKSMYNMDILYNFISRESIIPDIHLNFGIKPAIIKNICSNCGICENSCKVGAIKKGPKGKYCIDYNKCKYVRCLKCIDECPLKAIKIKGLH